MQHAFGTERLAEEHHRELVTLAQAEHAARRARRQRGEVHPWRREMGTALVRFGLRVGLPKPRRAPALGTAAALPEPPRLDCAP
ncbi:MAG: hypothetical protein ABR540_02260 [Acidimicrobiales bacterium]